VDERQILVNQVLDNLIRLHHPGVVTMPGNDRRELATTWEHYRFAPDGSYSTAHGAVAHDFWVSIFSYFFFITLSVLMCFLFYILFCSYVFGCSRRQPPGACTGGLQRHYSKSREGHNFVCSHSSK
jgi:hypothetical protein